MQVAIKGHKFELPGSPVVLCLPPKRAESFCRYHGRHPSDVQTDPTRQRNEKGRENNGRGNNLGGDTRKMDGAFNRPRLAPLQKILDPRSSMRTLPTTVARSAVQHAIRLGRAVDPGRQHIVVSWL